MRSLLSKKEIKELEKDKIAIEIKIQKLRRTKYAINRTLKILT